MTSPELYGSLARALSAMAQMLPKDGDHRVAKPALKKSCGIVQLAHLPWQNKIHCCNIALITTGVRMFSRFLGKSDTPEPPVEAPDSYASGQHTLKAC